MIHAYSQDGHLPTISFDIFRQVRREVATSRAPKTANVHLYCNAMVADYLYGEGHEDLVELERKLKRRVVVTPDHDRHVENYAVEVR